jgi:hypothetical protein
MRLTMAADMHDAVAALEANTGHHYGLKTGGHTPAHASGVSPLRNLRLDIGPVFWVKDVWPVDMVALPPGWELVASPRGYAIFIQHGPEQVVTHIDPRVDLVEDYGLSCH